MLMINNLIGFGASASEVVQTLVDRTIGTRIGNMTQVGGLAAAFDGTTAQSSGNCAAIISGDRTIGYCGKDWGASVTKIISGFIAYGPSDYGICQLWTGSSTIDLEGSTDNFSSSIVSLGTISFTDGAAVVVTKLTGLTATTAYRYHRVKITSSDPSTSVDNKTLAELVFYEDI